VLEAIAVVVAAAVCGLLIWRLFPNDRYVVSEEVDATLSNAALRALWAAVAVIALAVVLVWLLLGGVAVASVGVVRRV
jgi:hypothetical protein